MVYFMFGTMAAVVLLCAYIAWMLFSEWRNKPHSTGDDLFLRACFIAVCGAILFYVLLTGMGVW